MRKKNAADRAIEAGVTQNEVADIFSQLSGESKEESLKIVGGTMPYLEKKEEEKDRP